MIEIQSGKFNRGLKAIAIVVALLFTWNTVVWADGTGNILLSLRSNGKEIPPEILRAQESAADFPESKSNLKLLWIACGKDDRLIENARQLSAALTAKNIPHEFKETAGNHSWPVWRRYLGEFMPLLFVEWKAGPGKNWQDH